MLLPLLLKVNILFTMVSVTFTVDLFQSIHLLCLPPFTPSPPIRFLCFPPLTPFSLNRIVVVISRDGGYCSKDEGRSHFNTTARA